MITTRNKLLWLSTFAAIIVIVPFFQVRNFEFLNYDDETYVTSNPYVQKGLTSETFRWAFTTNRGANWHPLTWISHAWDSQFFGEDAGKHHLVNLFLHLANTILLLLCFHLLTGNIWASFLVAVFFGIHPLHVESVAWISARKDLLSTFFWIVTISAYAEYAKLKSKNTQRKGKVIWYLSALTGLALGLMAKQMLVTLPFVLILFDFWPLGRVVTSRWRENRDLIIEKIPFFMLTIIFCLVAYSVQSEAIVSKNQLGVDTRIINAVLSYATYIAKAIWPSKLAASYPYFAHKSVPWIKFLLSLTTLLGITLATLIRFTRQPYLLIGWLWYMGTLVPVIGLVQIGQQSMADRYTYVPMIGLFIMVAFSLFDQTLWRSALKCKLPKIIAIIIIFCLVPITHRQVSYWKDSGTLFQHVIEVTGNNALAHYNFAQALKSQGKIEKAIQYYYKSLNISPTFSKSYNALGVVLAEKKDFAGAKSQFEKALRIEPDQPEFLYNYGNILLDTGSPGGAEKFYRRSIHRRPDDPNALYALGLAVARQGRTNEAIVLWEKVLDITPDYRLASIALKKYGRNITER